jgi:hypothetical protein
MILRAVSSGLGTTAVGFTALKDAQKKNYETAGKFFFSGSLSGIAGNFPPVTISPIKN